MKKITIQNLIGTSEWIVLVDGVEMADYHGVMAEGYAKEYARGYLDAINPPDEEELKN